MGIDHYKNDTFKKICPFLHGYSINVLNSKSVIFIILNLKQEPWRLPSRQAEFNRTDRLRLDAHSDDQAVTGNQSYFEG